MALGLAIKSMASGAAKKVAANKLLGRGKGNQNKVLRREKVTDIMQEEGQLPVAKPKTSLVPVRPTEDSTSIQTKDQSMARSLVQIKTSVITIDTLLKGSLALDEVQAKSKRKAKERQKRDARESELEKKPKDKKEPRMKMSLPKMGFLDQLKNFISNLIFGWLALKLLDWAPKIAKILPVLGKAVDTLINWGGKVFNGIAWMIEKGYDAVNGLEKKIGDTFGEEGLRKFKEFQGVFTKLMNVALIAAMIGVRGGGLGKMFGSKAGRSMGSGVRGFTPRQLARGGGNKAIRRYAQRYGTRAAQRRFGTQAVQGLGGKFARRQVTNVGRRAIVSVLGKQGTKTGLRFMKNFISPIVKRIPFIGALIDFALNVFVFKEPIGKAAFKAIGAGLGLWIGAMLGSVIPVAGTFLGGLAGGAAGDALGGLIYDMIFGGKENVDSEEDDTPQEVAAKDTKEKKKTIVVKEVQPKRKPIYNRRGRIVGYKTVDVVVAVEKEVPSTVSKYASYESGSSKTMVVPVAQGGGMTPVGDEVSSTLPEFAATEEENFSDNLYAGGIPA